MSIFAEIDVLREIWRWNKHWNHDLVAWEVEIRSFLQNVLDESHLFSSFGLIE